MWKVLACAISVRLWLKIKIKLGNTGQSFKQKRDKTLPLRSKLKEKEKDQIKPARHKPKECIERNE